MGLPLIFADMSKIEAALGLPEGFIENLVEEDDWSFVIKSYSVIEAALSHVLATESDPRLAAFFQRLSLEGRASKLGAIEAINALDKPTRKLISRLAKIRNYLVHDVSHLSFTFDDELYVNERSELAKLIAQVVVGSEWKDFMPLIEDGLRTMAKLTLSLGITGILAKALFKIDPAEQERAVAQAKSKETIAALFGILLILLLSANRKDRKE